MLKKNKDIWLYKHVVSLGYYCGPAQELERIGYRQFSLPFDWLITASFQVVLQLIESRFNGFLEEDGLQQEINVNPKYYYDEDKQIHYYHDFTDKESLTKQLPAVKKKYARRIDRFYQTISEPTLFLRYCLSHNEYEWISNNLEYINSVLRKYNPNNDIVFVCNKKANGIEGDIKEILVDNTFYVTLGVNEKVSKHFLRNSKDLNRLIRSRVHIGFFERRQNLSRYYKKQLSKAMIRVTEKKK